MQVRTVDIHGFAPHSYVQSLPISPFVTEIGGISYFLEDGDGPGLEAIRLGSIRSI